MGRTALAAGGAALAIALAGCSGGSGSGGNTIAGDPQPLFGNTQELVDAASAEASAAKTTHMTMNMNFAGKVIKAEGDARFAGKDSAMALTMRVMGKSVEMRFIDQTIYVKKPGASSGKPWIKQPMNGTGMLGQFGKRADPTQLLKRIQQAGTITKSEKTQLNGQPVSHYWIKLDFTKMANMSPMAKQLPPQMMNNLKDVTLPMQLWLNAERLPVKVTMDLSAMMQKMIQSMKAQLPEGANSGMLDQMGERFKNMKVTVTYQDWGKPVTITAPPADKVTTANPSGQSSGSGSGFFGNTPNSCQVRTRWYRAPLRTAAEA